MSDVPIRVDGPGSIARSTRKLITDAKRAAAQRSCDLTDFARELLAGNRQRSCYFDPLMFGNPAWDMLLALFVAQGEGRTFGPLQCSAATGSPQRVTLRWLAYLESEGMVQQQADPQAAEGVSLHLSTPTLDAVHTYLEAIFSPRRARQLEMPPPAAD